MDQELKLKINDLKKALNKLDQGLKIAKDELDFDGVIQRFEISFELTWKVLQKYAKYQGLEVKSPREAFRVGGELGLIDNVEQWFGFLYQRNLTSHVYDEKMARDILKELPAFLQEAGKIITKI